ncbi:OLC1v1011677C1 [Oldenlandia corymbosa var. corymbosa]|uniref:OLC1v1011677C1 n=1 Tax=Oldenlandia corymbosa var. corymbosa TaxID=529605 RepID=A0AAV1DU83_OLDCO|nr:OLC1v1011677C1 [Oldenlandia corymbosa var. corymbosa]
MESLIALRASSENPQCSDGSNASPIDRISNLPEPIICYILSLLPTDAAIVTSSLSKSWQFLWTKVSVVDLDFCSCAFDVIEIVEIVNKVLIQLKSEKLDKFRLCGTDVDWDRVNVSKWLSEAIARNVKVIDMGLGDFVDGEPIQLPATLFTCETLESLRLGGPFLIEVPGTVHLPKLAVLELDDVFYKCDKAFHEFISSCSGLYSLSVYRKNLNDGLIVCAISSRSLRFLQLVYYYDDIDDASLWNKHLKIEAPALEHLILTDAVSIMFSLEGLISLRKVELDLNDQCCDRYCNLVVKQVEAMNCVKVLKLTGETWVSLTHATTRLSAKFEKLTKLYITYSDWTSYAYWGDFTWSFLNDLLDCSAKLEVLQITKDSGCKRGYAPGHKHEICWRKPSKVPECLSRSLAQVSFYGFEGLPMS